MTAVFTDFSIIDQGKVSFLVSLPQLRNGGGMGSSFAAGEDSVEGRDSQEEIHRSLPPSTTDSRPEASNQPEGQMCLQNTLACGPEAVAMKLSTIPRFSAGAVYLFVAWCLSFYISIMYSSTPWRVSAKMSSSCA
eukprot:3406630-Amphidinium_carterae.1